MVRERIILDPSLVIHGVAVPRDYVSLNNECNLIRRYYGPGDARALLRSVDIYRKLAVMGFM